MPTIRQAQEFLDQYRADELAHHGVLGQKWGVRHDTSTKGQTVKVSTTKDTKIKTGEIIAGGTGAVVLASSAAYYAPTAYKTIKTNLGARKYKSVIQEDLANIREHTKGVDLTKDFLRDPKNTDLPTGTVFHRIAGDVENSVDSPKYAAYLDRDVLNYRSDWTSFKAGASQNYKTELKALRDVTIASEHSMLATFEKEMHTRLSDGSTLFARYYEASGHTPLPGTEDYDVKKVAQRVLGHNTGYLWSTSVGSASSEVLQKAGYAAATDINNTGQRATHAVIVLDKTAFNVTSTPLSDAERDAAAAARYKISTKLVKAAKVTASTASKI